jgi:hypothetical protein
VAAGAAGVVAVVVASGAAWAPAGTGGVVVAGVVDVVVGVVTVTVGVVAGTVTVLVTCVVAVPVVVVFAFVVLVLVVVSVPVVDARWRRVEKSNRLLEPEPVTEVPDARSVIV